VARVLIECGVILEQPDEFYDRFFKPFVPEEVQKARLLPGTFPDALGLKPGLAPREITNVTEAGWDRAEASVARMLEAARADWPLNLGVSGEIDLEWLRFYDAKHDRAFIEKMMAESDPADFSNTALISCCELGAVMGHLLLIERPDFMWVFAFPTGIRGFTAWVLRAGGPKPGALHRNLRCRFL
jgi:hypothetical protein